MISPEEQAVIDAALEWYRVSPGGDGDTEGIHYAVEMLLLRHAPIREHALTWGQVPAGWEVLGLNGTWYRVESTRRVGGKQVVAMLGKDWNRDPRGPVTARGSNPAIEALGFPEVLEDGNG